jgi:ABC-type transport system involved in cytochrome bd biosynthesis fused ATPase/permease subunit
MRLYKRKPVARLCSQGAAMTLVAAPKRSVGAQLCGVVHIYPSSVGNVVTLRGVDLDIAANEAVALLGPSGMGESTVLSWRANSPRLQCSSAWREPNFRAFASNSCRRGIGSDSHPSPPPLVGRR